MKSFATSYRFMHQTSSPKYSQSNGQVEHAVQTIKNLLRKSDDLFLSLLVYRSTLLQWCNKLSPAELCTGRKLSTNLPQLQSAMVPEYLPEYLTQYRQADKLYKQRIKQNYDQRHHMAVLPELPNESPVVVEDQSGHQRESGFTVEPADVPRSYMVKSSLGGVFRQNRHQLISLPLSGSQSAESTSIAEPSASSISPPKHR